jgi:hypothetical protein
MKRLNEVTNSFYKSGFTREDGKRFYGYTKRLRKDGFFIELWLVPESYAANRAKKAEKRAANGQQ